jgi:hypothetical protein
MCEFSPEIEPESNSVFIDSEALKEYFPGKGTCLLVGATDAEAGEIGLHHRNGLTLPNSYYVVNPDSSTFCNFPAFLHGVEVEVETHQGYLNDLNLLDKNFSIAFACNVAGDPKVSLQEIENTMFEPLKDLIMNGVPFIIRETYLPQRKKLDDLIEIAERVIPGCSHKIYRNDGKIQEIGFFYQGQPAEDQPNTQEQPAEDQPDNRDQTLLEQLLQTKQWQTLSTKKLKVFLICSQVLLEKHSVQLKPIWQG